jgi:hypothetical protein
MLLLHICYCLLMYFLARYCMMLTTKLSVLELMIWEFQKMVRRRRIFNVVLRSKVSFFISLSHTYVNVLCLGSWSKKVSLCLAAPAAWLWFAQVFSSFWGVVVNYVNIESHLGRMTLLSEGCRGSLSEVWKLNFRIGIDSSFFCQLLCWW